MRGKHEISQKIGDHVKDFSSADIRTNNFHAKDSAILRIMTKWV
jgi:hypothetical protein